MPRKPSTDNLQYINTLHVKADGYRLYVDARTFGNILSTYREDIVKRKLILIGDGATEGSSCFHISADSVSDVEWLRDRYSDYLADIAHREEQRVLRLGV